RDPTARPPREPPARHHAAVQGPPLPIPASSSESSHDPQRSKPRAASPPLNGVRPSAGLLGHDRPARGKPTNGAEPWSADGWRDLRWGPTLPMSSTERKRSVEPQRVLPRTGAPPAHAARQQRAPGAARRGGGPG